MFKKLFLILFFLSLASPTAVSAVDTCAQYCQDPENLEEPLNKDCACACTEYCEDPENLEPPEGRTCICNPLTAKDFNIIVDNILDFIFKIAIVLAPLMVVVAGFMLITAGGSPEQISRAKNIIIWTAVGFAIVLLSKGVLAIINQILGVKGG